MPPHLVGGFRHVVAHAGRRPSIQRVIIDDFLVPAGTAHLHRHAPRTYFNTRSRYNHNSRSPLVGTVVHNKDRACITWMLVPSWKNTPKPSGKSPQVPRGLLGRTCRPSDPEQRQNMHHLDVGIVLIKHPKTLRCQGDY